MTDTPVQICISQKEAARLMNVSVRTVAMASELRRTGQSDIIAMVEGGALTLHRALKIAKPNKYDKPRDTFLTLARAWRNASPSDRRLVLATLQSEGADV
jgi:hypothetical protein